VKVVVLMPVVDHPIGSGKPHPHLMKSIESAFASGHDDVEVWCGMDGPLPEIEDALSTVNRVRVIRFEKTHSCGNIQRRKMMEMLPPDCLFGFMDHDDIYCDGGLKLLHDTSVKYGAAPVSGLMKACLSRTITNRHFLKHVAGLMPVGEWHGAQGCIFPSVAGMPLWGTSNDDGEDYMFCFASEKWHRARGVSTICIDRYVAHVKPWESRVIDSPRAVG